MCGIAGFVDYEQRLGAERIRDIATRMRDSLAHRGPDDSGTWVDPTGTCALAHRRLSILDLSEAGHQPMLSADEDLALTYNGEIYNYLELKAERQSQGATFRTQTDSEVLLEVVSDLDPEQIAQLDGMFAFGVWSNSKRRLLLARDAFGEKPLYLCYGDGWLAFASELRAIEQIPFFDRTIDRDAVAEYLMLQYVHAPRTIYQNTFKLPPGSWKSIDFSNGAPRESEGRHFDFDPRRPATDITPAANTVDEAAAQLKALLIETVASRMRSDVPLGLFLSGGIDSALIAAIATRELGIPIQSFSIGFAGAPTSEHHAAREVATHLGTHHRDKILSPDALALLPTIASALDEPLGDTSCLPTYLLSQFTREHVTVALSGDGGDELFGGYSRYLFTLQEEADWKLRLKFLLRERKRWTAGDAYCGGRWLLFHPDILAPMLPEAFASWGEERVSAWRDEINRPGQPLIHKLRKIDSDTYMPGAVLAKVDRMSMAFSLETRAPYLGRKVAAFASTLSPELCHRDGTLKVLLRKLATDYLPDLHVKRPKMGFGIPQGAWRREEVLKTAREQLLSQESRTSEFLARSGVEAFLRSEKSARNASIHRLWLLLILEAWLRQRDYAS